MLRRSVRMSIGKSPPDLWREAWDPDKHNLEREQCEAILTGQKLLVVDAVGNSSKLTRAATLPTRKLSIATLPSLIGRKFSVHTTSKPSNTQNEQANVPSDYKIVDKISPDNKDKGTFDLPECFLPLKCACGHETSVAAIRIVQNYLRKKPKRRQWEVIGVLPDTGVNEQAHQQTNGTQESISPTTSASTVSFTPSDIFATNCNKHPWPEENPRPRHFVLLERKYRCNCEKAYHPKHKLKVNYKPGYTPATPEEREKAREKWKKQKARSNSAAGGGSSDGAVAAMAAPSVSGEAACGREGC